MTKFCGNKFMAKKQLKNLQEFNENIFASPFHIVTCEHLCFNS